jgi:ParB/RepB/Spo0J family partition protein
MSTKPAGRRAAPRSTPQPAAPRAAKKPAGLSAEDLADLEASVFGAPPPPSPRAIAVGLLRPSPTNPRRQLGDLTELAASLKAMGQLQPIVVRPHPGEPGAYEIVCGHRRAAAASIAGLAEVLVVIRALDDRETLEAQIAENSQRADVHPMEEAAALHRLHQEHRVDVEELAARLGRSPFYVYQRLRLMKLTAEATQAFERGRLSLSVALALARFPEANQQIALPSLLVDEGQTPRQISECRAALDRLTLRLLDSPFALDDASLPGGACLRCPKRSGNQVALFTEAEGPDLCTDPSCYQGKLAALASRMALTPMPPSVGAAPATAAEIFPESAPGSATPAPSAAAPSPPAKGPRSSSRGLAALGAKLDEKGFDPRVFRAAAEAYLGARLDESRDALERRGLWVGAPGGDHEATRRRLREAPDGLIWGLWVEDALRTAGPESEGREQIERLLSRGKRK